jgi:hypothetical protein
MSSAANSSSASVTPSTWTCQQAATRPSRSSETARWCVSRGNYERWVLNDERLETRLSTKSIEWLRSLPESWSSTIDGVRMAMWHASVGSDMDAIEEAELEDGEVEAILAAAEADVLVVGHIHEPAVIRNERDRKAGRAGLGAERSTLAVRSRDREVRSRRASTADVRAGRAPGEGREGSSTMYSL